MLSRGTLKRLGTGKNPSQIEGLNLREGEVVEPYGFTTKPPTENEGFMLLVGEGDWGNAVHFLTTDNREKPALAVGEVALYYDKDNYIKLGKNETEIKRGEANLTIEGNKLSFHNNQGNLLQILDRLITELANHQTPTLMGPQMSPSALSFQNILLDLKKVLS